MVRRLLMQTAARGGSQRLSSMFRHLGALGLFFVAILDSSPLPTFGGPDILTALLAASHRGRWYEYAAVATSGSVLGAYLNFRIARKAGATYLDKKFKKGRVAGILRLFKKWAGGTLLASVAVPFPFPTGVLFSAAGVSNYRLGKFLVIVTFGRAVRYGAIAFVADHYGRHFIRVLRHPTQYGNWWLLFLVIICGLIASGVLINRRLATVSSE